MLGERSKGIVNDENSAMSVRRYVRRYQELYTLDHFNIVAIKKIIGGTDWQRE